jgi:predicted permease
MLDAFTGMLSGAATPCALFALGASLSAYRIAADLRSTLAMTGFKLAVHPLFVWLLATFVFRLDPMWVAIGTLTAALPVGANVFIMAQRYDVFVGQTTAAIVISSLASLATVSALIILIGPAH